MALASLLCLAIGACGKGESPGAVADKASAQPTFALPNDVTPVDLRQAMVKPQDYVGHSADTFRVMTWNVAHFTDEYDDPNIDNEEENNPTSTSEEKILLFTDVLRLADADVVALQEFESVSYAIRLSGTEFPELGYRFITGVESPTWHQNTVVMSRVPLGIQYDFSQAVTPVEGAFVDGVQDTQSINVNTRLSAVDVFVTEDYHFTLFNLHFKAGQRARDDGYRLGQAMLVRSVAQRFLTERPDARLLAVGDLNSTPGGVVLRRLLAESLGVPLFVDVLEDANIPTHSSLQPSRRIDYILPNPAMAADWVEGSMKVFAPLEAEKIGIISDHLPVVADFRVQ
jgi:endonuclease/exonuclease/phosphatase family metal-dependent hydrolase